MFLIHFCCLHGAPRSFGLIVTCHGIISLRSHSNQTITRICC